MRRRRCIASRRKRVLRAAALGADAAADEHPAKEDHDRHDGRRHEQEDQLLSVQLNFVERVVLGMSGQTP